MSTTTSRPLPGIRFDVPAAPLGEALPRMDIAYFVGFAARGPVDVPVAVDSLADFEAVFGGEMVLLVPQEGEPVRALLHPSIGLFFSQGGQRAWVMRVAGTSAASARFPMQRMLQIRRAAASSDWQIEPAWMVAASPGAWADALMVSCWTQAQALSATPEGLADGRLTLQVQGTSLLGLRSGDVLRMQISAGQWMQGCVTQLASPQVGTQGQLQAQVTLERLCSLKAMGAQAPHPLPLQRMVWMEPAEDGLGLRENAAALVGESAWLDGRLHWRCRLPARAALGVGEVVQLRFRNRKQRAWAALDEVHLTGVADANGWVIADLVARPWVVPAQPDRGALAQWVLARTSRTVHWLQASLRAQDLAQSADSAPALLEGLALSSALDAQAPTALNQNTDNEHFIALAESPANAGRKGQAEPAKRFPLASLPDQDEVIWLPLSDPANWNAPDAGAGLGARVLSQAPLVREGLADFGWRLFADAQLAGLPTEALASQAENLVALHTRHRPLRGLHAAFGFLNTAMSQEPTLLLAPDAAQPGWVRSEPSGPARIRQAAPPQPAVVPSGFVPCSHKPLKAPSFLDDADPDARGHFTVRWTRPEADPDVALHYELQESSERDFSVATVTYRGTGTRFDSLGKPRGWLYHRVRACDGNRVSPWSGRLDVRVGQSSHTLRKRDDADVLAVHRMMLRIAAARGDMLAVLGLPRSHTWADALAHVERLRSPETNLDAPGLMADEARALSHGCLQHPWLHRQRAGQPLSTPPDGAVAGQLAASAWSRGAWIAIANRPLKDVHGLAAATSVSEQQLLLDAQLNPLLATPHGFVIGAADTLCDTDVEWRPIHVRRLMSLLRRAALRRGAQYVFEPNGGALMRTIERAFETLLEGLHQRGAFAGRTPREAFQVVVDDSNNPPSGVDAGQLRIELKVAPAQALRFLTVRLVRSGERVRAQEPRS